MITKELFIEILKYMREADKFVDDTLRMRWDIADTPVYNAYGWMLDRLLDAYFTDEGAEHITWFIFEHHNMSEDFDSNLTMKTPGQLGMWDENHNPIPMDTIDELWEYVKDYRKGKPTCNDAQFTMVMEKSAQDYAYNVVDDPQNHLDAVEGIMTDYMEGAEAAKLYLNGN